MSYSVHTTPHFDRSLKKLARRHLHLAGSYAEAIDILTTDPQNLARTHHIRKLEEIQPGEGQYRLRLGRWRFRYDIFGRQVWLFQCSLRREETYR